MKDIEENKSKYSEEYGLYGFMFRKVDDIFIFKGYERIE